MHTFYLFIINIRKYWLLCVVHWLGWKKTFITKECCKRFIKILSCAVYNKAGFSPYFLHPWDFQLLLFYTIAIESNEGNDHYFMVDTIYCMLDTDGNLIMFFHRMCTMSWSRFLTDWKAFTTFTCLRIFFLKEPWYLSFIWRSWGEFVYTMCVCVCVKQS